MMNYLAPEHLQEQLAALSSTQCVAFAASCCERALPNYACFQKATGWGALNVLRRAVDAGWSTAFGERPTDDELLRLRDACELAIPDGEDYDSLFTSSAQDAAVAACNLLDYLRTDEAALVPRIVRCLIASIDLLVQERENMNPQDPEREARILEHPLMQQEILRQVHDLEEVAGIQDGDRTAIASFRIRTQNREMFLTDVR